MVMWGAPIARFGVRSPPVPLPLPWALRRTSSVSEAPAEEAVTPPPEFVEGPPYIGGQAYAGGGGSNTWVYLTPSS